MAAAIRPMRDFPTPRKFSLFLQLSFCWFTKELRFTQSTTSHLLSLSYAKVTLMGRTTIRVDAGVRVKSLASHQRKLRCSKVIFCMKKNEGRLRVSSLFFQSLIKKAVNDTWSQHGGSYFFSFFFFFARCSFFCFQSSHLLQPNITIHTRYKYERRDQPPQRRTYNFTPRLDYAASRETRRESAHRHHVTPLFQLSIMAPIHSHKPYL